MIRIVVLPLELRDDGRDGRNGYSLHFLSLINFVSNCGQVAKAQVQVARGRRQRIRCIVTNWHAIWCKAACELQLAAATWTNDMLHKVSPRGVCPTTPLPSAKKGFGINVPVLIRNNVRGAWSSGFPVYITPGMRYCLDAAAPIFSLPRHRLVWGRLPHMASYRCPYIKVFAHDGNSFCCGLEAEASNSRAG
jgi:hypothetical protein